ncbi:hypothetical protein TWF788_009506 [Orbilia oligospora]|uniref:Uncharacterized protein n=1 Tax=Orbilia oligospora TaxID=2813651 RepID=A0A7C8PHF8_ORBOL|nr:hypothetical protein TWF788_009506 [Orbilia oligospora]KAF3218406.1 hypothetical protein TWF679_000933 [Orbilia oligospora]
MTFREKIKSFLHHSSSHKKSISNATASSPTSTAAPTAPKPDPNKPPNARDPGFRKSFNLGEPPTSSNGSAKTEPRDIGSPNSKNLAVNGHATSHMYTLDKYDDDYLAVSPRTNVTVPEGNLANRGLAGCPPLDANESAKAGLGIIQEQKPKDDLVVAAAKTLDTLPTPQKSPDFGREQFANGERKDSGFVEPVPTRDTTVSPNSKPERPTALDLESSPPASAAPESRKIEAVDSTPLVSNHVESISIAGSPETKYNSLLVAPHAAEDGASSVYSDDSTRPTLQQIASSDYGPLVESPDIKATSPAPPSTTAVDHQRRYSILVSEELPTVEEADHQRNGVPVEEKELLPVIDENADLLTVVRRSLGDSSAVGGISPSILPADETNAWSQDLIANIDKIQSEKEQRGGGEKLVANGMDDEIIPDTAPLRNSKESVDIQATSLIDSVRAHVQPLQQTGRAPTPPLPMNQQIVPPADIAIGHADSTMPRNQESGDSSIQFVPAIAPVDQKPIVTTTNTVPHADAFHMGDNIPDVPVVDGKWPAVHPLPTLLPPSQKPIVTTTNTIPHAPAYNMGDDIPDVPVIEGKSPIVTTTNTVPHVKVIPMGNNSVDDDIPKLSFNESIYANRDKLQYDSALLGLNERPVGDEDSVYAVTKEIPGAF